MYINLKTFNISINIVNILYYTKLHYILYKVLPHYLVPLAF